MEFGPKLKELRKVRHWSQDELSNKLGVSRKTISNYEIYGKLPKSHDTYERIAEIFNVSVDFLRNDKEDITDEILLNSVNNAQIEDIYNNKVFIQEASQKYGYKGKQQAMLLVNAIGGMFAGGEISEEDMDGVMFAMQEHYWRAKKLNKKYTPKKYLK